MVGNTGDADVERPAGSTGDADVELPAWVIWGYVGVLVVVIAALLAVHVSRMARFQVDTTTILLLVLLVLAPSAPRLTSLKYGDFEATFARRVEAAKTDFDATVGTATPRRMLAGLHGGRGMVERRVEDAVSDVRKRAFRRYRSLAGAGLVEVLDALTASLQVLLESDATDLGVLVSELRRRIEEGEFHEVGDVLDAESVDALAEFVALSETALDEYCSGRVTAATVRELMELGLSYVSVLGAVYAAEYDARFVERDSDPQVADRGSEHAYVGSIRDSVEEFVAGERVDEEGVAGDG